MAIYIQHCKNCLDTWSQKFSFQEFILKEQLSKSTKTVWKYKESMIYNYNLKKMNGHKPISSKKLNLVCPYNMKSFFKSLVFLTQKKQLKYMMCLGNQITKSYDFYESHLGFIKSTSIYIKPTKLPTCQQQCYLQVIDTNDSDFKNFLEY